MTFSQIYIQTEKCDPNNLKQLTWLTGTPNKLNCFNKSIFKDYSVSKVLVS